MPEDRRGVNGLRIDGRSLLDVAGAAVVHELFRTVHERACSRATNSIRQTWRHKSKISRHGSRPLGVSSNGGG
jgi:hypothetical protein